MKTKNLENSFEVKEVQISRTAIIVPHLDDKVSFIYPAFKGTYDSVGKRIEESGFKKPTPEQTASLVYSAYENPDNEYAEEIKKIVKKDFFWMDNLITSETNKGLFIHKYDKQEVVFVPFGYKIGFQTPLELSKNEFVITLFGEEGADKIARVADKYSNKPALGVFGNVDIDEEIILHPILYSDKRLEGKLIIGTIAISLYNYSNGYAFGVLPN